MALFDELPDLNGDSYSPDVQMSLLDKLADAGVVSHEYIDATNKYLRKETSRVAEQFLWSDVSSDLKDRGVEIKVKYRGKEIPFRIKRALTLDERQRANDAAFAIDFDDNGKPKMAKQDGAAYTKEVVFIGLKYWPFEYSPGNPVPITRKTINEVDGGLLDSLAKHILGVAEVDKKQLDPLESQSEEDSLREEQPTLS